MDIDWINWYIEKALNEDVGSGDHSSQACIPERDISEAYLLVKDSGVLAGCELAQYIFEHYGSEVEFVNHLSDGDEINHGDLAFELSCNTRDLLKLERFVLNTMQRMSGIASFARKYADEISDLPVKILDTRKTTPLLRYLEKWAVRIGGCENYRFGLYDWIMIKDNHITAAGGVKKALENVHQYLSHHKLNLETTVEVRNQKELLRAMNVGGFRRVMLDNFNTADMREAVAVIAGQYEVEASGGITLDNLREVAETGVDFISSGALTHSYRSLDLSLKIR